MATAEQLKALRQKYFLGEFARIRRVDAKGKLIHAAPAGAGGPGKKKKMSAKRKKKQTTWDMPQQFGGRSWPHDRGPV